MLEKHKNLIENYFLNNREVSDAYIMVGSNNDYSFEVFGNELKIKVDGNTSITNVDNGSINIWNIKEGDSKASILINKVDSLDVVAMIAIIDSNNNAYVTIKQTPTNMYISYGDKSIGYYINNVNSETIINIIEDCLNKKGFLVNTNKRNILDFIRVDIDDIFITMNYNKENYINELNHQLNNINANYVMESESIKKKLKVINGYKCSN